MADEDFKEKDGQNTKTNTLAVGRSGTLITGDTVQDDYISSLIGIEGQEQYWKMLLSDSQIRKLYHALSNPIKSAVWDVEPASDDPKDLEVAALIKHIIFEDLPEGFVDKLDEILTFPWHGHAVFEVVHQNRSSKAFGPYTGLANIAFRDQRTLTKWKHSDTGILEFITQEQSGDVEVNADMAAETLMIFYNEKKGNDTGYPFCRMLYGNYKRKLLYKQLQAIGIERAAIPVPHLKLPATVDYDSDEYKDAVEQLAAFTQAEQAFFVTPEGYDLEYNQLGTFNPAGVQVAIKSENEEIAGSLVAMWLEMGIGGNAAVGSSTSESLEFFKDGIEYLADKVAIKFNKQLIPNLVALNFGDTVDILPKLVHNGIADDAGKELMEIVTGYTAAGVIQADEPLEDHVRKAHNLPKKAEGDMLDNKETEDESNGNGPDDDPDTDPANNPGTEVVKDDKDVELSTKAKPKTPVQLIEKQASRVSEDIRKSLEFSSAKYINDVIARYKQLPDAKKQTATSTIKIGGINTLKKDLKRSLTETSAKSIDMARKEVPTKKDIELSSKDSDMIRMSEKYGDVTEIKLNEFSKLPSHIQVLVAKQADLISEDSMADLKKRIDFSASAIMTKSVDVNVIRQSMEDEADKFITSHQVDLKGTNVASLMVNEGRDTYFFDDDVLDEIHSFTFTNASPKSAICIELAGVTFNTNDADSLRYHPPLHHNCKSYLRANLNSSKGTEDLEISSLSPSAKAKKSITL